MGVSLLHALIGATVASSLALLLIGVLRLPLRTAVGARAAYWLWLLIPAMVLATLLPARSGLLHIGSHSLTAHMGSALSGMVVTSDRPLGSPLYVTAGACALGGRRGRDVGSFATPPAILHSKVGKTLAWFGQYTP